MANKISAERRRAFFDLLCRHSSSDFAEYLRIYEALPRPSRESLEISCELIEGIKVDSMRLAVLGLRRKDVLRWIGACRFKIPLIEQLLFKNTADACFGIGLAHYPSGSGRSCRMKIYNEYGNGQSQAVKKAHISQLFALLNIPAAEFREDCALFKKIQFSGVDWGLQGESAIKVYFGLFPIEKLFSDLGKSAFSKEAMRRYAALKKRGLLAEEFLLCVKYTRRGRSLRTDMRYRTSRIIPYLRIFDPSKTVARFFADLYRIFHHLNLEYISMQWGPAQHIQLYINFPYE